MPSVAPGNFCTPRSALLSRFRPRLMLPSLSALTVPSPVPVAKEAGWDGLAVGSGRPVPAGAGSGPAPPPASTLRSPVSADPTLTPGPAWGVPPDDASRLPSDPDRSPPSRASPASTAAEASLPETGRVGAAPEVSEPPTAPGGTVGAEPADTAWAAPAGAGVADPATVGEADAGTEADAGVAADREEEADDAEGEGEGAGAGVALRSSGAAGRRPTSAARVGVPSGRASTDACAADHSQPASGRGPA